MHDCSTVPKGTDCVSTGIEQLATEALDARSWLAGVPLPTLTSTHGGSG